MNREVWGLSERLDVKDPNSLFDLLSNHKGKYSDKWKSYIDFYWNLFSPIKDQKLDILEIGIENGGSLEIWAQFFPNAGKIMGYDIDPKCGTLTFDDSRIQVSIGDSSSKEAGANIENSTSNLGIVIDDGSHKSSDIIRSFLLFFPQLRPGGLYVIEDLHTSYWSDWEGGISYPSSAMQFLKLLTDSTNFSHWGLESKRIDLFEGMEFVDDYLNEETLAEIESVWFADSFCVVKKRDETYQGLGVRVGSGSITNVEPEALEFKGTKLVSPDETGKRFSKPQDVNLVNYFRLTTQNQDLTTQNQDLLNNLSAMLESNSWRLTRPIRQVTTWVKSKLLRK